MYGNQRIPPTSDSLLILGKTTWRGQGQRFGILQEDRLRHVWVIGKTGSGKSTLLENLIVQDLEAGRGLALLDPHGDLVRGTLPFVPASRTNDVVLFAPSDREHPVSWNVLRDGKRLAQDPSLLASELVSVFRRQWADSWGPRLEHILRNALLAVAGDERANLLFLYRFLTEERLRNQVVSRVTDPVVKSFWTREFASYRANLQAEALSPVLNKLGAFVSNPLIRNIVGVERSRIDLHEIMSERMILLADLEVGKVGEDASRLLGSLLLTKLQLTAMGRARGGPPFAVFVDEFQRFVTDSIATLLSESRKFGLSLVIAHQYLAQLSEPIRDAVLGNVGTMVVFRIGAQDALFLEPELDPTFLAHDLETLPRYQMIVKMLARGKALAPFSAESLAPGRTPEDEQGRVILIREQSRHRYAVDRREVEEQIVRSLPS